MLNHILSGVLTLDICSVKILLRLLCQPSAISRQYFNCNFFVFCSHFLTMFLFLPGVESTDQSSIEIHFQSESTAAGLKDLVREFIKKATTVGVYVRV